jgi:K+-sensing histidine kinase KdpD
METGMFHQKIDFRLETLERCTLAVIGVAAVTAVMWLIGRAVLGEAVIALLYLLPIGYSTTRWGQAAGISAAVAAALAFDFFFIPPFYTFTVGHLEGWLVLIIFLLVAILIVGRIQVGLAKAKQSEREAIFLFELASALAGVRSYESIARILAEKVQQVYQARLVQVSVNVDGQWYHASAPGQVSDKGAPDRVLPILAAPGISGEINIWSDQYPLPAEDDRLFQSFPVQGALALERIKASNV